MIGGCVICPYCDQGSVHKVRVKRTGAKLYLCDECDTVWCENEPVTDETGAPFDIIATGLGIEPLWSELETEKDKEQGEGR